MHEQIKTILDKEQKRQDTTIELIASENYASQAVMDLCGSIFTNKYAEGYPGKRYYNGCDYMDEIEQLAIDSVCTLYGCKYANVQPHSGVNANTAVYQALMNPGDTLMGMDLASGGHLSHGAPPTLSGKVYNAVTYGVDENGLLNYEEIRALAKVSQPKVIVAGASAYPRQINWQAFKDIADGIGAYLVVDMAHYSGLVAGKVYDSPLPYADVVTSTTHKTLRGPRGGMILWNNPDYTRKFNSSIFPGTQGGPLMNIIAAKAQCYIEANTEEFREYSAQVIKNAQAMARQLEQYGIDVLTGGTDSHIILIDLSDSKYSGREAADLLEANGITVNKNGVPNDPRNFVETSGIRIGTAAETTKGHKEYWFRELAQKIANLLRG
tara:strand:- start:4832 stop:5974 length:1143 start_codon:yes stop_codon:yes gene_type:complete